MAKKMKFTGIGAIGTLVVLGFIAFQSIGGEAVISPEASASEIVAVTPDMAVTSDTEAPANAETPVGDTVTVNGYRLTVVDWVEDTENIKYNRNEQFKSGWRDVKGFGCDARNDVLIRDMHDVVLKDDKTCVVNTGTLNDKYTSQVIPFQFGQDTSAEVQIDHIIPLKVVWYAVAHDWTLDERVAFANDSINLVATGGKFNNWKNAKDADEVLAETEYMTVEGKCFYTENYVLTATTYSIPVRAESANALANYWSENCA